MTSKIANPRMSSLSLVIHLLKFSDMLNLRTHEDVPTMSYTSHISFQPSLPQTAPASSILEPHQHALASQPNPPTSEENGNHTCKECKKEFIYRADYEAHQILGCHLCERCGNSFKSKAGLSNHRKSCLRQCFPQQ